MSSPSLRFCLGLIAVASAFIVSSSAQELGVDNTIELLQAALPAQPLDLNGDPLPPGAIARLGKGLPIDEHSVHRGPISALAFSPSSKHVASASHDGKVAVWQARTEKLVSQVEVDKKNFVRQLAFSQDGKLLLGSEVYGKSPISYRLRIWDAKTGKERKAMPPSIGAKAMAVRGAASLFAGICPLPDETNKRVPLWSFGDNEIRIWEFPGGKLMKRFGKFDRPEEPIVFSPVGLRLASGGARLRDKRMFPWDHEPRLLLWDGLRGKVEFDLPVEHFVVALGFTPDGRTLISGMANGEILLWGAETGKQKNRINPQEKKGIFNRHVVAISPDGKIVAIATPDSGKVSLWEVASGKQVGALTSQSAIRPGVVWSFAMAFSPDNQLLASGGSDTTILVWDVAKLLDSFRVQGRN